MPSKKQNLKRRRKVNILDTIENQYYIFCEGKKTEPLYFEGFKKAIAENALYKNMVHVEITGLGQNTMSVMKTAQEFVRDNKIKNAQVWCVYDKDSFADEKFNAVEQAVCDCNCVQDAVRYCAAWSNECIEFWFILHFSRYDANNNRAEYQKFLNSKFRSCSTGKYEKNDTGIFNHLVRHGNPKQAIKWAKEILQQHGDVLPSKAAPATKVHLLVEELAQYLPGELQVSFL